jgi:hypothetical protein
MSYALKLAGAGIALLLAGVLAIILFEGLWYRIGIGAAIVVVVGGLLFVAWRQDKKAKEARAGLERI